MYEKLITALITMVFTIITTMVVMRLREKGRLFSQSASGKVKASAKRYGWIVAQGLLLAWSIYWLVYNMRQEGPVTRGVVLTLSVWTVACVGALILLGLAVGELFVKRYVAKAREELRKELSTPPSK